MVLEAAAQIAETDDLKLSDVEYFDIKNVSLSTALIVPEEDRGIETLFAMRPVQLNNVSRYQWLYEFVLTSVSSEDGQDVFSEHCRGQVEISFAPHGKMSLHFHSQQTLT
jgi:hypothetical protein